MWIEVGLLLRLESDGLICSIVGPGVVGGVEKVSASGDSGWVMQAMLK